MSALEYMKKQVEKNNIKLSKVIAKTGVTEEEINNIRSKIGYYQEAVNALETMK